MTQYWRTVLLTGVMTAIFLTGCMGKVKYPAYYRLNLAPPGDPPAKGIALPSIAVREFRAPAYLREGPIVYLATPEKIGFYEYHRWAVDPRQTITGAIAEYLRASGKVSRNRKPSINAAGVMMPQGMSSRAACRGLRHRIA